MNVLRSLLVAGMLLLTTAVATAQCPPQEQIDFCGTIYSQCRTTVQMPDGRYLSVPVVNGYLPDIREDLCDGQVVLRVFSYVTRAPYTGGVTKYGNNPNPTAAKLKPPVVTESREQWDKLKAPQPIPVPNAPAVKITDGEKKLPAPSADISKDLREIQEQIKALKTDLEKYRQDQKKETPRLEPIPPPTTVDPLLKKPSEIKEKN